MGIGLPDAARNPFLTARLPVLTELLGGALPHLDGPEVSGPRARVFPVDATMGMDGVPRSGTGQAALLTGENAAILFGGHFGPWVPAALRPRLAEDNLLLDAVRSGRRSAFANAYPRRFLDAPPRHWAGPPLGG